MTIFLPSTVFFLSVSTFLILRVVIGSPLWRLVSSYSALVATSLARAWDASLDRAFFGHSERRPTIPLPTLHKLGSSFYRGGAEGEAAECAICLCSIEPGAEIRELRCNHLFHGACLDRWLELNRLSCPLCRGFMAPRRAISELGAEVLVFKFCDVSSNSREDTWWLR